MANNFYSFSCLNNVNLSYTTDFSISQWKINYFYKLYILTTCDKNYSSRSILSTRLNIIYNIEITIYLNDKTFDFITLSIHIVVCITIIDFIFFLMKTIIILLIKMQVVVTIQFESFVNNKRS